MAELKKLLAEIEKGGGGLLFVDEAYTLNPNEALSQGKQVLDYLLPEMENKVVCERLLGEGEGEMWIKAKLGKENKYSTGFFLLFFFYIYIFLRKLMLRILGEFGSSICRVQEADGNLVRVQ